MNVDTTALRSLANRVRRGTANRDIVELADSVASLITALDIERAKLERPSCPVCEARRFAKAASQRKWRAKERLHAESG